MPREVKLPAMPVIAALPELPHDERIEAWLEIQVAPGEVGPDTGSSSEVSTLEQALSMALAQDPQVPTRIRLPPGIHDALGSIENVWRTSSGPIVISGSLGPSGEIGTIIDGGANGTEEVGSTCIHLSNVSYITLENMQCRRAFPHGINVDDGSDYSSPSHHIVIRNWHISDVGMFRRSDEGTNSDCLKLSGVDDFHVLNSQFERCVWGEFIDMVGSHRGVIAGNHFRDKPLNGLQTKGGSADILITRNRISDVEGRFVQLGGDTGEPYYRPLDATHPASRIVVTANILSDVGIAGTPSEAFSLNGCRDCLVAHNTVLNIGGLGGIAYIDEEEANLPGNENVLLANNVYVFTGERERPEYRVSNRTLSTAGIEFHNEIHYLGPDNQNQRSSVPSGFRPEQFHGIRKIDPGLDRNGIPAIGSPVIGAGKTGYEHLVPKDFLGEKYDVPPAIGAYRSPHPAGT